MSLTVFEICAHLFWYDGPVMPLNLSCSRCGIPYSQAQGLTHQIVQVIDVKPVPVTLFSVDLPELKSA